MHNGQKLDKIMKYFLVIKFYVIKIICLEGYLMEVIKKMESVVGTW